MFENENFERKALIHLLEIQNISVGKTDYEEFEPYKIKIYSVIMWYVINQKSGFLDFSENQEEVRHRANKTTN